MDANLLEKEQTPPRVSRNKKLLAIGVCVLIGLGCSAATFSRYRGARVGLQPMLIDEDYNFGSPECFKFTGGTCNVYGCAAKRHSTCKGSGLSHYCACDSDAGQGCVGGDGNCWSNVTSYEKIASGIRLKNVKWDSEYLYCPSDWYKNQLRVDKKGTHDGDTWSVYRVPGKLWQSNNQKTGYMVQNDRFPEYAAAVWVNKLAGGILNSAYEVRVLNAKNVGFDPLIYMQWICKNNDGSIRIDGLNSGLASSWYVHHMSWEVFGWFVSDPGPGGYWKPDPPLSQAVMDKFEYCD